MDTEDKIDVLAPMQASPQETGKEQPEEWETCEVCGGSGERLESITVYEHGCGFSHDDVYSRVCEQCGGAGGEIVPAQATSEDDCLAAMRAALSDEVK